MKIALLLIWFVYVIRNFGRKKILIIVGTILVAIALFFLSYFGLITEEISTFIRNLSNPGDVDVYLSGGYSRTAALRYLLTDGFSWIGAGPNAFYDRLQTAKVMPSTSQATVQAFSDAFSIILSIKLFMLIIFLAYFSFAP